MKHIKVLFLFTFLTFSAFAQESGAELSVEQARGLYSLLENIEGQKSLFPEEVNAANLKVLIKPEYADVTILYEENPYALNIMNCVFIEVMKNNLICFETYVSADSSLTLEECAKIANDWNNRHSFATVSFNQGEFYIQYYLSFSGGLHADNFNDTIEWVLASSFHFENYLKDCLNH